MSAVADSRSRLKPAGLGAARPLTPAPLVEVETGRLWIASEWVERLTAIGLGSFRALMDGASGVRLRQVAERENWRLELPTASGVVTAYLKKHRSRSWRLRWRSLFGAAPAHSPGRVEAENIARLTELGIPTMRPIAYGEERHADGLVESLVMTEELRGYVPLDDVLRARFSSSQDGGRRGLRRLLAAVAHVATRFHASGFNHRDFYGCHFFIHESAAGRFDVRLIDLQRVQRRRWLRRRWIVKDLAQLAYSTPRDAVRTTDAIFLFKHYLGVRKLRPEDKRLWRRVLARMRGMERRLGGRP